MNCKDCMQDCQKIGCDIELNCTGYLPKRMEPFDGDIYWNPAFGDLWIVDDKDYVKINDGYRTEIENTVGFIKVGHVNVETR